MLNLFVAVIMDNFDYLTRDSSILGPHHLDEYIRAWAEYDPGASGRIKYTDMYDMLRNMEPPVGFGKKCPYRLAYRKLIRMNMPVAADETVHFTTTLFALIRESLCIKMGPAHEMDIKDDELRETIKKLWPIHAKKILAILVPPNEELTQKRLTVGKIYAGLLISENWKAFKASQTRTDRHNLEKNEKVERSPSLFSKLLGRVRNSTTRSSNLSLADGESEFDGEGYSIDKHGKDGFLRRGSSKKKDGMDFLTPNQSGLEMGDIRRQSSASQFSVENALLNAAASQITTSMTRLSHQDEVIPGLRSKMDCMSTPLLSKMTPGPTPSHTPKLTPNLPRGANTVMNILTPANARKLPSQLQSDDIQTIKVTDITTAPQLSSLGSLFSSINKSVSSALSNIMSFQQQPQPGATSMGEIPNQRPQVNTGAFMPLSGSPAAVRRHPGAAPPQPQWGVAPAPLQPQWGVGSPRHPAPTVPSTQLSRSAANINQPPPQYKNVVDHTNPPHVPISGHPEDYFLGGPRSRDRGSIRQRPPLTSQRQVFGSPMHSPSPSRSTSREPLYKSTSLETRSRTPSPHPIPGHSAEYYGGANLSDRSRSPSPTSTAASERQSRSPRKKTHHTGRKLPALPLKPSSLNIPQTVGVVPRPEDHMPHVLPSPTIPQPHKSPGSINFPRLNPSPTRYPRHNIKLPPQQPPRGAYSDFSLEPSPSERNDLNMPPSHRSQQRLAFNRRTNSGDGGMDGRDRHNIPRSHSGQLGPRYVDRDNRYLAERYDQEMAQRRGGSSTLPNGFKPIKNRSNEHESHHSESDDDWC